MQNRLKIALVVAVFFGLIAAYGIFNFLSQTAKEKESLRAANQDIVVAGQDIPPGTTLNDEAIKKGAYQNHALAKSFCSGRCLFLNSASRWQGKSGKDHCQRTHLGVSIGWRGRWSDG